MTWVPLIATILSYFSKFLVHAPVVGEVKVTSTAVNLPALCKCRIEWVFRKELLLSSRGKRKGWATLARFLYQIHHQINCCSSRGQGIRGQREAWSFILIDVLCSCFKKHREWERSIPFLVRVCLCLLPSSHQGCPVFPLHLLNILDINPYPVSPLLLPRSGLCFLFY